VNANFVLAARKTKPRWRAACNTSCARSRASSWWLHHAPAGPEDVTGQGMTRVGALVERFLAPDRAGG